jgi:sugar phosphate isomerase/epimerase
MIGTTGSGNGSDWAEIRDDLLRFAKLVEARHLVCAAGPPELVQDIAALVRDYRSLCEAAGDQGTLALLEAMPWSSISSIAQAAEVVAAAGHPAGGVMLDTWHFHRVGGVPNDISAVPAHMIRLVQISDAGPPIGDPFDDTVKRRLFPGEGGFALVELMRALTCHGVSAPVSVEVIGEVADRLSASEMARRSFSSTEAVLTEAGFEPSF